jgi:hypothetical protein
MNAGGPPAPALDAQSFPHPVRRLELVETHLSWVALTGDYAYKIKKPVRFEFVDATTLESRRALCETELQLNRRFAPDLYLDVVALRATGRGRLRFGGAGEIVDYAVRMREFDRRQELSALLARGDVSAAEIAALAALLADFHDRAEPVTLPAGFGSPGDVRDMVHRNLDELVAVCTAQARHRIERLRQWIDGRFAALESLIAARQAGGRLREGHGDLHSRNIVRWQGRLTPFDCLEFDASLRRGDVALDLAFLYMDLESKQRSDLAAVLLDGYCARGGDYHALAVLDLYAVHRALVRAKIDALQAAGAVAHDRQAAARVAFGERLDVAERLTAARDPVLVLMHGVSGSGKSWVSEAAVPVLPALRIRSDVERRRVAGIAAGERTASPLHGGAYTAELGDRTYRRLLECARSVLLGGRHVIVDAAFLDARRRAPFIALAAELGCRLLIADCTAPVAELHRRVSARSAAGRDPSEATTEVLADQLRRNPSLLPEEQPYRLDLDTARLGDPAAAARALVSALQRAPRAV